MARSGSPTLETLAVVFAVFVVQSALGFVGSALAPFAAFALAPPLDHRPWTLVTSVYAHANLTHLLTNAAALAVFGLVVERATTRLRFHAFFVATGALAGVAQVLVSGAVGQPTAVLGASGAVMALLGYLVTGNRLSRGLLARFDPGPKVRWVVYLVLAAGVVLATAGPRVALVAHATGFILGLVSGRLGLLRVRG
jgi:membrane associated rhomboid family serine protease